MSKDISHTAQAPRSTVGAMSVTEFLKAFGIGRTKLYAMVKQGELRVLKSGRRTLITYAEIERWLSSLPSLNSSVDVQMVP